MDFIPVTKIKIDKTRWLNTKIKYELNTSNEDILNDMCENVLAWINKIEEYELNIDRDSFNKEFKNLIYDKYI